MGITYTEPAPPKLPTHEMIDKYLAECGLNFSMSQTSHIYGCCTSLCKNLDSYNLTQFTNELISNNGTQPEDKKELEDYQMKSLHSFLRSLARDWKESKDSRIMQEKCKSYLYICLIYT